MRHDRRRRPASLSHDYRPPRAVPPVPSVPRQELVAAGLTVALCAVTILLVWWIAA